MIITRYLAAQIIKSTSMVLLILVCMRLFFIMVRKVDLIGNGAFGVLQFFELLMTKIPYMVVDFMPLAALLGSILSLGALASGSEIIAFQSSGLSLKKFVTSVTHVSILLAVFTFIIADQLVPVSETRSKELDLMSRSSSAVMQNRQGVWIKDKNNILFIGQLFPDGNAKNIEIFHLNDSGDLVTATSAEKALMQPAGWQLQKVKQSVINENKVEVLEKDKLIYQGQVSDQLLESIVISSNLMSVKDLYRYINFLEENNLNHKAESLTFWQKIYTPLTIIVMCVLAIPFVIGSQRDSNTGQRLIVGIVLGLSFYILNRILIQLGEQMQLLPAINALLPTAAFIILTIILIQKKAA